MKYTYKNLEKKLNGQNYNMTNLKAIFEERLNNPGNSVLEIDRKNKIYSLVSGFQRITVENPDEQLKGIITKMIKKGTKI